MSSLDQAVAMAAPLKPPALQFARACSAIGGFEADDRYVMEKKYDGFRLATVFDGRDVKGYARSGADQDLAGRLPRVRHTLLRAFGAAGCRGRTVLDGELVSGDDSFRTMAGVMKSKPARAIALQQKNGWLDYVVFDVLFWDGQDVRGWTLEQRRRLLEDRLALPDAEWAPGVNVGLSVRLSLQGPVDSGTLNEWIRAGGEGAIVKRLDRPYSAGRPADSWYKLKAVEDADVVVMGFTPGREGKGVRRMIDTVGAIVYGQYKDGVLTRRGQCSGMDDGVRFGLLDLANGTDTRDQAVGKVMVIRHMGVQAKGFRHPQFQHFRDDKRPEECEWTS